MLRILNTHCKILSPCGSFSCLARIHTAKGRLPRSSIKLTAKDLNNADPKNETENVVVDAYEKFFSDTEAPHQSEKKYENTKHGQSQVKRKTETGLAFERVESRFSKLLKHAEKLGKSRNSRANMEKNYFDQDLDEDDDEPQEANSLNRVEDKDEGNDEFAKFFEIKKENAENEVPQKPKYITSTGHEAKRFSDSYLLRKNVKRQIEDGKTDDGLVDIRNSPIAKKSARAWDPVLFEISKTGDYQRTFKVFNEMKKCGAVPSAASYVALFFALRKIKTPNAVQVADSFFEKFRTKDFFLAFAWSAYINVLAINEQFERVLTLMESDSSPLIGSAFTVTIKNLFCLYAKDNEKFRSYSTRLLEILMQRIMVPFHGNIRMNYRHLPEVVKMSLTPAEIKEYQCFPATVEVDAVLINSVCRLANALDDPEYLSFATHLFLAVQQSSVKGSLLPLLPPPFDASKEFSKGNTIVLPAVALNTANELSQVDMPWVFSCMSRIESQSVKRYFLDGMDVQDAKSIDPLVNTTAELTEAYTNAYPKSSASIAPVILALINSNRWNDALATFYGIFHNEKNVAGLPKQSISGKPRHLPLWTYSDLLVAYGHSIDSWVSRLIHENKMEPKEALAHVEAKACYIMLSMKRATSREKLQTDSPTLSKDKESNKFISENGNQEQKTESGYDSVYQESYQHDIATNESCVDLLKESQNNLKKLKTLCVKYKVPMSYEVFMSTHAYWALQWIGIFTRTKSDEEVFKTLMLTLQGRQIIPATKSLLGEVLKIMPSSMNDGKDPRKEATTSKDSAHLTELKLLEKRYAYLIKSYKYFLTKAY